ncbi:hypothetical protein G6F59_014274 [Rhizopus arrhizus]|nr:hypothetical protein G6F59_014274 [Rhizopus arrhizus]
MPSPLRPVWSTTIALSNAEHSLMPTQHSQVSSSTSAAAGRLAIAPVGRSCAASGALTSAAADEPGRELAEGGIGIGVGAAGHRHHRGELGVGQCAEGAADGGQHERQHDRRAGVVGGGLAGDDEDAAADHRADAEGGQPPGAEVAAQAEAVGVFMGGMRVLGGPQLLEHVWWSCRSAP